MITATDYVKKKKSSDIKWFEMLESLGFKNVDLEESIRLFEAMMLSRLVDTFFSRTSWTMLLYAENHSISVA